MFLPAYRVRAVFVFVRNVLYIDIFLWVIFNSLTLCFLLSLFRPTIYNIVQIARSIRLDAARKMRPRSHTQTRTRRARENVRRFSVSFIRSHI